MKCLTCGHDNAPGALACVSCGSILNLSTQSAANPVTTNTLNTALPSGTKLQNGAYTVGQVLGQGGFGVTYKGADVALRRLVAIKEFFPTGSVRQGVTVMPSHTTQSDAFARSKTNFVREASTLARFNHPSIVRVYSVVEENNTAYMVMEFLEGQTLQQQLAGKGVLSEAEAVSIVRQTVGALEAIHGAGLLHRDLKPDNIFLTENNRVVLIDFGTAREYALDQTRAMTQELTPGYAPLEQYGKQARFGPYTDVYALGAMLYHCLTGTAPASALDRATGVEVRPPSQVNPYINNAVSEAVMWALQLQATNRPQTAAAFLAALEHRSPIPQSQPTDPRPGTPQQPGTLPLPGNMSGHSNSGQPTPGRSSVPTVPAYPPGTPSTTPPVTPPTQPAPGAWSPHSQGYAPQSPPPPDPARFSGQGAASILPAELRGVNFGAFFLSLFWAIAHRSWIGLLVLIPYVGWIMAFFLLFKGNELAWKNRHWDSVEQFRSVQRSWMQWGVGVTLCSAVVGFVAVMPVFSRARANAQRTSCQSNLKQMALAVKMYIQDYDEMYPLASGGGESGGWAGAILPYLKSEGVLRCPGEDTRSSTLSPFGIGYTSYRYNRDLSIRNESEMNDSALYVLLAEGDGTDTRSTASYSDSFGFDGTLPQAPSRHLDGANYAFLDGHVKWYSTSSMKTTIGQPSLPSASQPANPAPVARSVPPPLPTPLPTPLQMMGSSDAYDAACEFVRGGLARPDTAEFLSQSSPYCSVWAMGTNRWRIESAGGALDENGNQFYFSWEATINFNTATDAWRCNWRFTDVKY